MVVEFLMANYATNKKTGHCYSSAKEELGRLQERPDKGSDFEVSPKLEGRTRHMKFRDKGT